MATKRKQAKTSVADRETENVGIWLTAIEDYTDRLTYWEKGFIENMNDIFYNRNWTLSPAQYETLERIYRRFY